MERLYFFLGRVLFPRQQDWQQTKSAKIFVWVVAFSLILALCTAKMINLMYYHVR